MSARNCYQLKWDCEQKGCFNTLMRLKFAAFSECFPGKINFTDVDGIVEIAGRGLVLEWKERPLAVAAGQRILWSRLTRDKTLAVIVVAGSAADMTVTHTAAFWAGMWRNWQPSNLHGLKRDIRKWVSWAQSNPLV
jgi:hypothetical protein